jgi:hypothetical protein
VTAEDANITEPETVIEAVAVFESYTEQIGVLRIGIEADAVRLMMKDPIIKYFTLQNPDRLVIDFKIIRYFEPEEKAVVSPRISRIATATHDAFNRLVLYLNEPGEYTINKDHGDWLIRFK